MLRKLYSTLVKQRSINHEAELRRRLMRHEAQIGGTLFGPIPAGGRREFFCLDEHTWVWHEEWTDQAGQPCVKMIRYDVRPNGVLKVQDGHYQAITPQEAYNLRDAVCAYVTRVGAEVYRTNLA